MSHGVPVAPTALVTGARTGVGLALTNGLLDRGWRVLTLTRTPLSATPKLTFAERTGSLRHYYADLDNFDGLRTAIAGIQGGEPRLDALINNAGVNPEHFERSREGREMNFEVNAVVPYILSRGLLPLLAASGAGRIVNVSSNAVRMAKSFDVAKLDGADGDKYRKLFGAYANCKLALSLWSAAAAPLFAAQGVHILSADPGATKSPLTAGPGMPWPLKVIAKFFFKPPEVASERIIDLIENGRRFDAGSYVKKGKSLPVPRREHADAVLAHVERIYHADFASS